MGILTRRNIRKATGCSKNVMYVDDFEWVY